MALIKGHAGSESGYSKCKPGGFQFPQVLAPLRDHSRVQKALDDMGCDDKQLAQIDAAADHGGHSRSGDILLPAMNGE